MLEIFLTEHSEVEDLLCGAPSGSKACLFFSDDLLHLWLQSAQYDHLHDFAWVTDKADRSIVPALLQVAFLGKCDDKGWVQGVCHSPICQILLQIIARAVITSSLPAWTNSAGMLSTPAHFLFFTVCTAASTSLRRIGWSSSVSV